MSRQRRLTRFVALCAGVFVAGVIALAPAASAAAHDFLVETSPAANSTQTRPLSDVVLTYSDIVLDLSGDGSSSLVQVTGPDGAKIHFETSCPSVIDRVVTTPIALGDAGTYEVTWQIVSADGHTVSGSYQFSYDPPAGTPAAKGSDSRPNCAASDGTDATSSSNTTNPPAADSPNDEPQSNTSDSADLSIVVTIAAIIVGLAIVGVIIVLATRQRTPRNESEHRKKRPQPDDE